MRKYSETFENYQEKNVGNELYATSVTNHFTPVQNIITNINNLFCTRLSIVATIAEDGISVKLSSSKFTSEQEIDNLLYAQLYNDTNSSLAAYIISQGLDKITKVNLGGGYYVVYFGPSDIATTNENPVPSFVATNNDDSCKADECPNC